MISTLKVVVHGDTYSEIADNAEKEIYSFLEVEDEEDSVLKVSYELLIEKDEDIDAEFDYRAEVIARIK